MTSTMRPTLEDFLRRLEAFLMQYNPVVNDRGPL